MTADEIASVTLEHLRHIRGRVDQIADDVVDLKLRMSGLEGGMARIRREVVQGDHPTCFIYAEKYEAMLATISAIITLAEKLEKHFAALPHQDVPGILSQKDGAAFATALCRLAEMTFENLELAQINVENH